MATSMTVDAIIFAINSAIKLGSNAQKAYINRIRDKDLLLPLLAVDFRPTLLDMYTFFDKPENSKYLNELEDLLKLHKKAGKKPPTLNEEELEAYRQFYFNLNSDTGPLSPDGLLSLLKIRQFEKNKTSGSVLQAVAGSLVEIGVDYFKLTPGALNPGSVQGRLFQKFLGAFDGISLADNPNLKQDISNRLLPNLFSAAAESLGELSPRIAADEKVQDFIQATAKGIANDIFERAAQRELDETQKNEAVKWGQVVLRSMIHNGGNYIISSPQALFGTNQAVSQIIESSGRALLDAILDDESDSVNFRNALSQESLDQIARAALSVVAEHPQIISGNKGIKEIIAGVATAVQQEEFLEKGFLPELTRIVLEQSAGRLDLLWKETPTGPEHILVSALGQVLSALSEKQDDATWKPVLSKKSLLSIVEELVDDVAKNPAWILDEMHGKPALAEVMEATFAALRTLPKGERVNAEVFRQIIRLGLQTTLVNPRVLNKINWGTDQEETAILSKGLEIVFAFTFPKDLPPSLNRLGLMTELLEFTTGVVLRQHPDKRGLILLSLILSEQAGMDFTSGFQPETAKQLIESAFAVLAQHPNLVTHDKALQQLLGDIAETIHASGLKHPDLLPDLIRLTLDHSAGYLEMLWDVEQPETKHLLVQAAGQTLRALAQLEESGKWAPKLSHTQILEVISLVYQAVVANPKWVRQEELIFNLLKAIFAGLRKTPDDFIVTYPHIRDVIEKAIEAASKQKELLSTIKLPDGTEELLLQYALEQLFQLLFKRGSDEETVWYLSQAPIVKVLVEHYLGYLTGTPYKEEKIKLAIGQMEMAVAMWKAGFSQDMTDILRKLRYLFLNPEGMEEGNVPWSEATKSAIEQLNKGSDS